MVLIGLLTEPESSDDELDTEDGEVDTLGPAKGDLYTQRTRVGRTEATRGPPSAPPALASTSTHDSHSQMKRKEPESLFMSKKRARYALIDQDNAIDPSKHETKVINGKSVPGMLLHIH